VFKEIRNFIVNSLKGKYTEKVSFKATKGNKMVLNSLPQKKVLYKYNVKRPINISEAIILILVSIILFKNIIIVVTVIIFTSAIVYAFYPRNNESIAWEKYKRIKLQKELQMNDIKEILKDKKIEYYEKNDKIEIKTNKGKIIILKGSERNKKGKELVLSLEKDWINIINNNSVLLKIFIKIIYSYM
jgi:hypothetical protein